MDTNEHQWDRPVMADRGVVRQSRQREWFSDQLLHGPLVYDIVGAAIEVLNSLGHGLYEKPYEKPYENALIRELLIRNKSVNQQRRFEIRYKGHLVGELIPDLIVDDAVIVDTKIIDRISSHEMGQMLNYLRITGLRVGLIINFRHARLDWERVVL